MEYRKICENTSDMNAWELSHNHVFIKNGEAWYGDFEREIPVRELIKEICKKHACQTDVDELSNDEFDDVMYDNLQYGTDELEGIVALLYMTMTGMAETREWLKEYEQGGLPVVRKPEVLKAAISTYGEKAQADVALEEMSELTKAVLKFRRATGKVDDEERERLWENIVEETADVMIMLAQMIMLYDRDNKIQSIVDYKVNRLYERLGIAGKVLAEGRRQDGDE